MANTDRFKHIDANELSEFLKGVGRGADRDLVNRLTDIDRKAFSDTIKNVEDLQKSFKDVQTSKKKRFGTLSSINEKILEREQKKATKKVISGMEKAINKKMRQESIKRTFTMSKGKKVLSYRSEKETLKTTADYTKDLIAKFMKQGMAEDSKEISSLKSVLIDTESRIDAVNGELYRIKGGEKFRIAEIDKLNNSAQVILQDIKVKQQEQESLTKEKTEQIEELLKDGFDEQSESIKELKKQLSEATKSVDSEVEKLQAELAKTNKEVGYLENRANFDNPITKMLNKAKGLMGMGGGMPDLPDKDNLKKGKGGAWNKIKGWGRGSLGGLLKSSAVRTGGIFSALGYGSYKIGESVMNQTDVPDYLDAKTSGTPSRNELLYRPKDNTPIGSSVRIIGNNYGVDPELLRQTMGAESGGKDVKNRNSSASGLFQFTNSTWIDMLRKHGAQLGVNTKGMSNKQLLSLKHDRGLQMKTGALFTKTNIKAYEKTTGYGATWADTYVMHLLGGNLGITMLKAVHNTPSKNAKSVIYGASGVSTEMAGKIIKYNLPFFESKGRDLSALGFYSVVMQRMGKNSSRMAGIQATKGTGAPIDMISAIKSGNLTTAPLRNPTDVAMTNSIKSMGYIPQGVQESDKYASAVTMEVSKQQAPSRRETIVDETQQMYGLDGVQQDMDLYNNRYNKTSEKAKNNSIKIKDKIKASIAKEELEKKKEAETKTADKTTSNNLQGNDVDKRNTPVTAMAPVELPLRKREECYDILLEKSSWR